MTLARFRTKRRPGTKKIVGSPVESFTRGSDTFTIRFKTRPDGIKCFFFYVNNDMRMSSYDEKGIVDFVIGYTDGIQLIPIEAK